MGEPLVEEQKHALMQSFGYKEKDGADEGATPTRRAEARMDARRPAPPAREDAAEAA